MEKSTMLQLPDLPYGYKDLSPFMSEEQLRIHHTKHHQAYVNGANALLEQLDKSRRDGSELNFRCLSKELTFNLGGNTLHSIFWRNLAPPNRGGGGRPGNLLGKTIDRNFGSFDRFKKEFTMTANSCEGSGWAAVTYCETTKGVGICQIEKHNVNLAPNEPVIMALDMWEHAFYLDYKNDKGKYIDAFWNIVNWDTVNRSLQALAKPEMATV
ncbi:MAG: superoxide dismutase [Chloroflexi bacterium]|nr:superoxide dismutase [Chloroflexota bacterium]